MLWALGFCASTPPDMAEPFHLWFGAIKMAADALAARWRWRPAANLVSTRETDERAILQCRDPDV
jgi:hypothetical protein